MKNSEAKEENFFFTDSSKLYETAEKHTVRWLLYFSHFLWIIQLIDFAGTYYLFTLIYSKMINVEMLTRNITVFGF